MDTIKGLLIGIIGTLIGVWGTNLYNRRRDAEQRANDTAKAMADKLRDYIGFLHGWYADIESISPSAELDCISRPFMAKRSEFITRTRGIRESITKSQLAQFDDLSGRVERMQVREIAPVADRGKNTVLTIMKALIDLLAPPRPQPEPYLGQEDE